MARSLRFWSTSGSPSSPPDIGAGPSRIAAWSVWIPAASRLGVSLTRSRMASRRVSTDQSQRWLSASSQSRLVRGSISEECVAAKKLNRRKRGYGVALQSFAIRFARVGSRSTIASHASRTSSMRAVQSRNPRFWPWEAMDGWAHEGVIGLSSGSTDGSHQLKSILEKHVEVIKQIGEGPGFSYRRCILLRPCMYIAYAQSSIAAKKSSKPCRFVIEIEVLSSNPGFS